MFFLLFLQYFYTIVAPCNPQDPHLYYEPLCSANVVSLGCNAAGLGRNCRFCDYGIYNYPCPPATSTLFYKRFIGNFFQIYEGYKVLKEDYCNQGNLENCVFYLNEYNGWSTNSSSYVIDSTLSYKIGDNKCFGGNKFGNYDLIAKRFVDLPFHVQVEISFTLFVIGVWQSNNFFLRVDGVECFSESIISSSSTIEFRNISVIIYPHELTSLEIEMQSNLDVETTISSWGIQNFKVFLKNYCHSSCRACEDRNYTHCTVCPFHAVVNSSGLCECVGKFFLDFSEGTHCESCDISCKTCSGPTNQNCSSCYEGDELMGGSCVSPNSI